MLAIKSSYLNAPLEVRILHQSPVSELPLEKLVDRRIEQSLQLYIQIAKIFENLVFVRVLEIRFFAKRTNGIRNVPVANLDGEVILCAFVAAAMYALEHGDHLKLCE